MGTIINCLACGHDNGAREETCAACCASLRLELCTNCEAINPEDALRCHNCSTERSRPSAWLISGESSPRRRGLQAALLAVPVLAVAAFAAYHFSHGVPEVQAVTVTAPGPGEPETTVAPPKAPVKHTRSLDSASSAGATRSTIQ